MAKRRKSFRYKNKDWTLRELAEISPVSAITIYTRITVKEWSIHRAVTTPPQKHKSMLGTVKPGSAQDIMRNTGICPKCNSRDIAQTKQPGVMRCRNCVRIEKSLEPKLERITKQSIMHKEGYCPDCFGTRFYKESTRDILICATCCANSKVRSERILLQDIMKNTGKCTQCDNDKLSTSKRGHLYCRKCLNNYSKEQCEILADSYIKNAILNQFSKAPTSKTKLFAKDIPQSAIETKRAMLKFKRELKKWKEVQNE